MRHDLPLAYGPCIAWPSYFLIGKVSWSTADLILVIQPRLGKMTAVGQLEQDNLASDAQRSGLGTRDVISVAG